MFSRGSIGVVFRTAMAESIARAGTAPAKLNTLGDPGMYHIHWFVRIAVACTWALFGLPLVGTCLGVALVAFNPPHNPIDYWPIIGYSGAVVGLVGLL